MDKLETVANVAVRMNHKSYNGEVTYEVPCFDECLEIAHKKPMHSMLSHSFKLEWAQGLIEIDAEAGDLVSVRIKLDSLEHAHPFSEYLWELRCTLSIVDDAQKLFNVSWNGQGKSFASRRGHAIEGAAGFSVTQYLTAAKAFGKASTLRTVLQYKALRYDQVTPEYNTKPAYPGGIGGNPELLEALRRGAESDFIISCEGQEYPVHRIVLKWASPVFRRMIETPMQEASSNKLVISDVESKVVQMMIDFIYKGRIDVVLDSEAVSLLYCAEKYELMALREHCLKYMKTIVSDTNVTEFLSSAVKCNAGEVVKELVDWCKKRFWELSQKDEFRAYVEANSELFYGGK